MDKVFEKISDKEVRATEQKTVAMNHKIEEVVRKKNALLERRPLLIVDINKQLAQLDSQIADLDLIISEAKKLGVEAAIADLKVEP